MFAIAIRQRRGQTHLVDKRRLTWCPALAGNAKNGPDPPAATLVRACRLRHLHIELIDEQNSMPASMSGRNNGRSQFRSSLSPLSGLIARVPGNDDGASRDKKQQPAVCLRCGRPFADKFCLLLGDRSANCTRTRNAVVASRDDGPASRGRIIRGVAIDNIAGNTDKPACSRDCRPVIMHN
jgi:hypothetical protein